MVKVSMSFALLLLTSLVLWGQLPSLSLGSRGAGALPPVLLLMFL